jgi:hypothetical protein
LIVRSLLLWLTLSSIALVLIAGACSAAEESAMSGGDADADSDTDVDTDTGDVPIEYPEMANPFLKPNSLMTGPISPPPEDVFGDELAEEHDLDAGLPEEDPDEDFE